jgi:hypothetical protein
MYSFWLYPSYVFLFFYFGKYSFLILFIKSLFLYGNLFKFFYDENDRLLSFCILSLYLKEVLELRN